MTDFNVAATVGTPVGDIDEKLTHKIGSDLLPVVDVDVNAFTLHANGAGNVENDVNVMDFFGQPDASNTDMFATIGPRDIVNITHNLVLYSWIGPHDVTIGLGGSYVSTAADYIVQGTADHSLLANLTDPDQHPTAAITGLDTDQATQDQNLVDHEVDADPHPQYTLETSALQVFVGAGYGGVIQATPVGMPALGPGWDTVPFAAALISSPRLITQDFPNNGLIPAQEGIWLLSLNLVVSHNESNSGRVMGLRLFNVPDAAPGPSFGIAVARNQPGTNINISGIIEISASAVGDLEIVQLSGLVDTFTNVDIDGTYSLANLSPFVGSI